MKTKILSGLICCLGIFSANAQTITAPVGQSLSITNSVDISGDINLGTSGNNVFKLGGATILKNYNIDNTGIGIDALKLVSGGYGNVAIGNKAGSSVTNSGGNVMIGSLSGQNATGIGNTFIGFNTGKATTGDNNSFIGYSVGSGVTTGSRNIFLGTGAGFSNAVGNDNVLIGESGGYSLTSGNGNTFLGRASGFGTGSGSNITLLGYNTAVNDGLTNATAIGANAAVIASNSLVLGKDANVGIGTNSPTAKLEITTGSTTVTGLKFTNVTSASATSTGGSGKVLSVNAAGEVILVGLTGGAGTTAIGSPVAESTWKESDGYLYNNSTNGVVIKGTGLDGNSLIVKGGVLSKEVNVKVEGSESWPDYVFKPNYKRMTLGEVEKFISINGHLPNIPSATEMAATGNNLGKTDVKLLEKVEELTLYLLDMKKVNDAQVAELKALKQQVNKLRKK